MIKYKLSTKSLLEQEADCLVFFLEEDFKFSKELSECARCFFPQLKTFMKDREFTGAAGASLLIPVSFEDSACSLLFIGIGPVSAKATSGRGLTRGKNSIDIENFRRAVGSVVRTAESKKYKTIALGIPARSLFGVTAEYLGKQVATIVHMARYHFDKFITKKEGRLLHDFQITCVVNAKDKTSFDKGIKTGTTIADAVNVARDWIDTPAEFLTPTKFANDAKKIAKDADLKVSVFDGKKIKELGMGGLEAVSRGSDQDCRMVIVQYKAKKKNAQTIGLVGKGITFDSGGLSLKPADYMDTMKDDMSGAAAVIAAMKAIAVLKPSVNVVAVAALAENMPGAKAFKPGDILKFYNGKTAEILNTDAEGRLVLADALSYITKHYKLNALIDLATLTGACMYALGHFFCGLMSQHENLSQKVQEASVLSGDRVWPLPFHDDYKPAIKSDVADIKNTGSKAYMAGTTTAGFFLQNFVGDTPWVHLDIAGTAFNVPDISYFRKGGTGFGVRLLVELVTNWK